MTVQAYRHTDRQGAGLGSQMEKTQCIYYCSLQRGRVITQINREASTQLDQRGRFKEEEPL